MAADLQALGQLSAVIQSLRRGETWLQAHRGIYPFGPELDKLLQTTICNVNNCK
jgi:hypothetical protein